MNEPDPAAGASGDRDTRPPTGEDHRRHLLRAVELAREGSSRGDGGPFGAVVVLDGRVVGEGWNLSLIHI